MLYSFIQGQLKAYFITLDLSKHIAQRQTTCFPEPDSDNYQDVRRRKHFSFPWPLYPLHLPLFPMPIVFLMLR
jgi:hypothetical protein